MAKEEFKCYAVRKGRVPGIYSTWDECREQVSGYTGAEYHKFCSVDEAKAFLNGEEVLKTVHPQEPYAFVDGSYNPATKTYGYGGFLCANGQRYPLQGFGTDRTMSGMRNVAGEISGSMAAVRKAEELGLSDLTILYDYRGIEAWAAGSWRTNNANTAQYAAFMQSPDRTVKIRFEKVAAHTGIEGNEIADVMAKAAVGIDLDEKQSALLRQGVDPRKQGLFVAEDVEDSFETELPF